MKNKRYIADMILFIASMIWGIGYYFQKVASETTAALPFNCLRYVIAALFLLCAAKFRLPRKGSALKYTVLAGIMMFMGGNLQQIGMQTASIGNSSFITSIYIVLVPFFAALILHRKIKPALYLAAVLSLIGLYLITTGGSGLEKISKGDMIVFAGSVFWALQILAVDKAAAYTDPIALAAGELTIAAILQIPVWLTFGHRDLTGITQSWPWAAASGILVLGIAFIMQAFGQKHTGETEASIIMGLESVFGALFGVILYHEQFSPAQGIGMVLIFAAVLIAVLKSQEQ